MKRQGRFHGSVLLDPIRTGSDAGRIAEEVVSHLTGLENADVRVTLEISVEVPDGTSEVSEVRQGIHGAG